MGTNAPFDRTAPEPVAGLSTDGGDSHRPAARPPKCRHRCLAARAASREASSDRRGSQWCLCALVRVVLVIRIMRVRRFR